MKDGWWWTSTPYIDAYSHAEWVSSSRDAAGSRGRHLAIDFEDFEKRMRSQAMSWGEQGLGTALTSGRAIPVTDDGRYVYAIGVWDDKYWVAAGVPSQKDPYWWEDSVMEVVEFVWPNEWDVT